MPVGHAVTATSERVVSGRVVVVLPAPAVLPAAEAPRRRCRCRCARATGGHAGGRAVGRAGRGGGGGRRRGSDVQRLVDEGDDLVGVLRVAQRVGEGRLHQRARQLGQQLQVGGVAPGRGGDEEGQLGGTVLGPEVHGRAQAGEGEGRLVDAGGAAVRDRDAAGQPRRGGLLAGERVGDELVGVRGASGVADDGGQTPDHVLLVVAPRGVEAHQFPGDQIGHAVPPKAVTVTSSVRRCDGSGIVVPGRAAAALP